MENKEPLVDKIRVKSIYYPEGLDIEKYKIINFVKPILGFDSLREFCILNINKVQNLPFYIFQSVENEKICFIIADPNKFFKDYFASITDEEKKMINLEDKKDAIIFVIANLSRDLSKSTVNLKAPIVINTKNNMAIQAVLNNDNYSIRQNLPIQFK